MLYHERTPCASRPGQGDFVENVSYEKIHLGEQFVSDARLSTTDGKALLAALPPVHSRAVLLTAS